MALEVYKRGQGRAARTVTAVSLLGILAFGCVSLRNHLVGYETFRRSAALGGLSLQAGLLVALIVFLAGAAGVAWMVTRWRRGVDFLVLTESELRKVSWPSRSDLRQQTAVVILVATLFGVFIFVADVVLKHLFEFIGIL